MSTSPAALAPIAQHPDAPSWREIPALAARLLWRHWPALLFWFFAQRVCYDLLMALAVKLSEHSALLAYAALAVLIVTQLAGTILMFQSLRPSLPGLSGLSGGMPTPDAATVRKQWVTALAIALLPFFAYYVGWGLLENLRRSFRTAYVFSVWDKENLNQVLQLKGLWIALVVAWAVRWACKRRAKETGHAVWTALATACEAYWVFVGVAAITQGIGLAKDWWHQRVAYVALQQWWENPLSLAQLLPPIKRVLMPAWDIAVSAAGGLVLPLIWLAIVAIIYGIDLRHAQRLDDADASLGRMSKRYRTLPFALRIVANKASAGWTSKGVPVVNSLRLALRAGLPALLTLCVCWELLEFVDSWAWRAMQVLIGPQDPDWQSVIGQQWAVFLTTPLSFRTSLVTDLLRTVLLAATFDRAIARLPKT